ncbi:MAG: M48 family metalloprotease [Pyrinomonadaceae bacterium]|nr:M48 family metalloprotease [Pyrinomonadaceae bacterium]
MTSNALLTFLLNAVWQIPLIGLAAYICDYLLKRTNARIRHTLWFVTLILCFTLPIFSVLKSSNIVSNETPIIEKTNFEKVDNLNLQPTVSQVVQTGKSPAFLVNENLSNFLIACYILFSLYSLIKFLIAFRRTQTLVKTAFTIELAKDFLSVVESCKEYFETKTPQILFSKSISSPFTIGAFKPLIFLPIELAEEKDQNLLFSVIGHELAHIKKRDYLLNLMCEFICLPISFHPVATLVKRRIKEARELRCDEMVIDKLVTPNVYAQSLVHLASSAIDLGRKATMTVGVNDADILENRIMKILKRPKITASRRNLLLISASALFIAVFIVIATFTLRPAIAQQSSQQNYKTVIDTKKGYKTALDTKEGYNTTSDEQAAKRKAELDMMNYNQSDLSEKVKITMAQAIDIATKQESGLVMECRLVSVKEGQSDIIYYAVRISKDKDNKKLLINAIDGKIK